MKEIFFFLYSNINLLKFKCLKFIYIVFICNGLLEFMILIDFEVSR